METNCQGRFYMNLNIVILYVIIYTKYTYRLHEIVLIYDKPALSRHAAGYPTVNQRDTAAKAGRDAPRTRWSSTPRSWRFAPLPGPNRVKKTR